MFATSFAVLLLALAAIRFPDVPLLALLPAVAATAIACSLPRDRGAWISGLLAAALFVRLPAGLPLALATAFLPLVGAAGKRFLPAHPALFPTILLPVTAYLAAAAGSGSFSVPFTYPLDLCAAVALGATLTAIAYAPTERERLGPRGRARFRVR